MQPAPLPDLGRRIIAGRSVDFILVPSVTSTLEDIDVDVMCLAISPARLTLALRGYTTELEAPKSMLSALAHWACRDNGGAGRWGRNAYGSAISLTSADRVDSPRIVAGGRPLEITLQRFFASLTAVQQLSTTARMLRRSLGAAHGAEDEPDAATRFFARLQATIADDCGAAFALHCGDELVQYVVNSMRTLDRPHAALCPSRPVRSRPLVGVIAPSAMLAAIELRYDAAAEGEAFLVAPRRRALKRSGTPWAIYLIALGAIVLLAVGAATLLGVLAVRRGWVPKW